MVSAAIIYILLASRYGTTLERFSAESIDDLLERIRQRLGTSGLCLLMSVLFLGFALLYVRPDVACRYLGGLYARMASAPFDWAAESAVGFRRLTPTISYLLGLGGRGIIITNLLFAWSLLYCVARFFAADGKRLSDAMFGVAAITFSLVTLTTIHCGGYTDSTTYLIVFLMWWFRSRRTLFYILFFVGLLNREATGFLLPWFALLRWEQVKSVRRWLPEVILGFGITLSGYYWYREFLAGQGHIKFSTGFYLGGLLRDPFSVFGHTLYYHGLGLFSVFKVLWVFPLMALVSFYRRKRWLDILGYAFLLGGTYLQLLVAGDTSRMLTLGFMVMPIALVHLLAENQFNVRSWIIWAFLANLAVPTLYTAQTTIEIWQPLWRHLLIKLLN